MKSVVRVLLVEDHTVVREGLRLLFTEDGRITVAGEAGTLAEAMAATTAPDLVVADLTLPDARGATTIEGLRTRFADVPIFVLTASGTERDVDDAFSAGATGFILKGTSGDQLIEAALRVAAGERYLDPALGGRMVGHTRRVGSHRPLSRREREVLQLLVLGHTNAEIGELLGVSLRTVEGHRMHIQRKLNLRTRAELVRYARETGLTD